MNSPHVKPDPASAPYDFEMPGFRGRIIAQIAGLLVVEADVDGDIPAHRATSDELAYVLSGQVEVLVEGQSTMLHAGASLQIRAGQEHASKAHGPARVLLIGEPDQH